MMIMMLIMMLIMMIAITIKGNGNTDQFMPVLDALVIIEDKESFSKFSKGLAKRISAHDILSES